VRLLSANTDKTYFVQFLNIPYCHFRHEILNHPVIRIQKRFFPTALESSTSLCISLPSTFTVPVCRLLKDTGTHYFRRLFLWTMWFEQHHSLKQPLLFAFPVWYLACDNKWGDCSFKFDLFLDVFINWCQNCQSTTGLNRLSI